MIERNGLEMVCLQNITKMVISHQQDYMITDWKMAIGLIIMKMDKLLQKAIMQMEKKLGNGFTMMRMEI